MLWIGGPVVVENGTGARGSEAQAAREGGRRKGVARAHRADQETRDGWLAYLGMLKPYLVN